MRKIPANSIKTPATMTKRNNDASRLSGAMDDNVEPAARAAALVVVTTMSAELDKSPPTIGPRMLAYKP